MMNYVLTMNNIEEHLIHKSNHNTTAKNLEGSSSTGFLSEILTGEESYFSKIRVDRALEFVTMDVYPGINVLTPYRAMAAQYCMEKNSEKKVGSLCVSARHGDVYCHVETSIKDAPLSGETLEEMERIAISLLHSCQDELELIAHGVLPSNKEEGHGLSALLSKMRKMHEKKDGGDRDDEAMPSGLANLFEDLPDFISSTLSDDDESDSSDE